MSSQFLGMMMLAQMMRSRAEGNDDRRVRELLARTFHEMSGVEKRKRATAEFKEGLTEEAWPEDTECAICADCDRECVKLPCDHYQHKDCILQWLEENAKCPICREEVPCEEQEVKHETAAVPVPPAEGPVEAEEGEAGDEGEGEGEGPQIDPWLWIQELSGSENIRPPRISLGIGPNGPIIQQASGGSGGSGGEGGGEAEVAPMEREGDAEESPAEREGDAEEGPVEREGDAEEGPEGPENQLQDALRRLSSTLERFRDATGDNSMPPMFTSAIAAAMRQRELAAESERREQELLLEYYRQQREIERGREDMDEVD